LSEKKNVIIMGAAGRDFHNFNVSFRDNPNYNVVAFTATQIPDIAGRRYPSALAGKLYPQGIPIHHENELPDLIKKYNVSMVVFAYSDVPYSYVMRRSAIVNAAGADFYLQGPNNTMLKSNKPVLSVCAVRTGCGKSPVSRAVFNILRKHDYKVVSIRHPMPYDPDLTKQVCMRFASYDDLDKYDCTIEEREEFEPYIDMGGVVYAGVDYKVILSEAEREADVIIWDGGNNDFPFIKPDLHITIADPHRPGHEVSYYPGEVNARLADIIIINKVNTAKKEDIAQVEHNIKEINPDAKVINGVLDVIADKPDLITGKKTLVIEDGPTVTHGEMSYGAGMIAALNAKAKEIIDPRPYAVGSIKNTFETYHHLNTILPAMGYSKKQIRELERTINATPCDVVVSGTPIDLNRILKVDKPIVRVKYDVADSTRKDLELIVEGFIEKYLT